jgi:hypothetical protein
VGGGVDPKWTPPNLTETDRVIEMFWHDEPPTLTLPLKGGGDQMWFPGRKLSLIQHEWALA